MDSVWWLTWNTSLATEDVKACFVLQALPEEVEEAVTHFAFSRKIHSNWRHPYCLRH